MSRIKYFNKKTGKWEYADSRYVVDSGGNVDQGLTAEQITALNGMFKVCAFIKDDVAAEYTAFKTAFGIADEEEPDVPVTPDEPDEPEVTLSSISATYSGGDVTVGTAVTDLTGITVTAHYSDGTSEAVTGYTLSGTIAEGSNTITVNYGGMTATFTVTGVAESGGEESGNDPFAGTWVEGLRLQANGAEYATGHDSYDTTDYVDCGEFSTVTISAKYGKNTAVNAVVWYDASKSRISGEGVLFINSNSTSYPASVSCTKPDGSAYCRLCGNALTVDGVSKRFAEVVTITVS